MLPAGCHGHRQAGTSFAFGYLGGAESDVGEDEQQQHKKSKCVKFDGVTHSDNRCAAAAAAAGWVLLNEAH